MAEPYELPDEITIATVSVLYQSLVGRLEEGEVLQVNAAEVQRFDGAALQCLFQLWQIGQVSLVNATEELREAAQMMGLGDEFLVH